MRPLLLVGLVLLFAWGGVHLLVERPASDLVSPPRTDAAASSAPDVVSEVRLEGAVDRAAAAGALQAASCNPLWGEDVTFRVVSEDDGRPIPGALVHASVEYPEHVASHDEGLVRETTTDENGIAHLPRCRRRADYCVRKEGYLVVWLAVRDEETHVALTPVPAVRGQVLDPEGHALAGARVCAECLGIRWTPVDLEQRTDEEGRFLIAGTYHPAFLRTWVAHDGYGTVLVEHLEYLEGKVGELVITMGEGAVVKGTVEDEDGHLIVGAEVFVGGLDASTAFREEAWEVERNAISRMRTITDAHGRFLVRGVPALSERVVCARSPDGREGQSRPFALSDTSARREIAVRVAEVGSIAASFVEAETGKAIPVGDVLCAVDARWADARSSRRARRDRRAGRMRLGGVPPGVHQVYARNQRCSPPSTYLTPPPVEVEVRSGEETRVEILFEAGRKVTGRVVDEEGRPREASVSFESTWCGVPQFTSGQTGAEGRFELPAVPPVKGRLTAIWETGERHVQEDIEIEGDLGDLVLERAPTLVGRVPPLDAYDAVWAHLESGEWSSFRQLLVQPDGRFVIDGLPVGEKTSVFLVPTEGAVVVLRGLVLGQGEERDLGRIAFPPETVLEGRVLDEAGEPVAGAVVRGIKAYCLGEATTGTEGRFWLRRLPAGPVTLGVYVGNLPLGFFPVEVCEGMVPLALRLPRPGRLRARFLREDGEPLPLETVSIVPLRDSGDPDWDRKARLETDGYGRIQASLPPGAWTLRVSRRSAGVIVVGEAPRVEIRSGETTELDVRVR